MQNDRNDLISRQAVLEYIEGSEAELGHSSENELVCQDIKELPSVTPKQDSCEDYISRRAVLNYIYNDLGLGDEENGKDVERKMELESSYKYVKSLPHVQAESCGDCVSRQAVIDAFHTWFRDGFNEDKWWNSTHVLAAVEGVSPVPQKHKWETCFDCPLSHGCLKIKGCTNEQAIECASKIPNDCPFERKTDGDAISRQTVKEQMIKYGFHAPDMTVTEFVEDLPSVKPQEPKTGHWIYKQYGGYPEQGNYHCSECDKIDNRTLAYCPHCGCAMIDPQERNDKE